MCKWFKKLFSPKNQETTRKEGRPSMSLEVYDYQGRKGITAQELQRLLGFMTIEQVKDAIDTFNKGVEVRRSTGDADYSMMTDKPIWELKSGTEVKRSYTKSFDKVIIEEDTYFIVYEDLIPLLFDLLNYIRGILKFKKEGKEATHIVKIIWILSDALGSLENPNYQTTILTKI